MASTGSGKRRVIALLRVSLARRLAGSLGIIVTVDHPISATVTRAGEKSQRAFAVAALRYVEAIERVSADVTDEGLVVRGLTEVDVELAVDQVEHHFTGVICTKPEVAYCMGPPLLEPYYRAIIDVPEECWGRVMEDMSNRRGFIQAVRESPIGKRFVAEVPVSECFGYSTTLRSLTRGRGTLFVEFCHYRPAPGHHAA